MLAAGAHMLKTYYSKSHIDTDFHQNGPLA